jgi:tRNA C32,U32 (ribose-2'-O)-methylase TrmJ
MLQVELKTRKSYNHLLHQRLQKLSDTLKKSSYPHVSNTAEACQQNLSPPLRRSRQQKRDIKLLLLNG